MQCIRLLLLLLAILCTLHPQNVVACDPCSLYNAARIQGLVPGTFSLSLAEQNTSFNRPSERGTATPRNGEFVRQFSNTQVSAAYDFSQRFGIQATVPIITRVYDAVKDYRYDSKSEVGIGDISLLTRYSFLNLREQDWAVVAGVTAGIKLATGDTGTLGDISQQPRTTEPESLLRHHQIATASGGRALTLGTGSTDFIFGANLFSRFQRFFLLTDAQYSVRQEGDFNYEFADDKIFSVGPGYYVVLDHQDFLAARVAVTGEFKGADRLNGAAVSGSKISNIYLGPEVLFGITQRVTGQLGLDFRTTGEEAGSTVVPEYRLRFALGYRFS